MQIPRLPVSGENLKKYLLDTIRGILDYLKATRLVEGDGISLRETPSGVVVSAIRRGTTSQGASGAAEYSQGIGITITGGTPGVPDKINANITGGTDISVTGGTNGNPLVISYTGGGGGGGGFIPDWGYISGSSVGNATAEVLNTSESPYIVPSGGGYLYAFARVTNNGDSYFFGSAHLVINGGMFKIAEAWGDPVYDDNDVYHPAPHIAIGAGQTIPVRGGSTVYWHIQTSGDANIFKGCVFYQNTNS